MTWICIAHVESGPEQDILEGAKGAFVPVVGIAESEGSFRGTVAGALAEAGLVVKEIDDVIELDLLRPPPGVDNELLVLASQLSEAQPVLCAEFEAYLDENGK